MKITYRADLDDPITLDGMLTALTEMKDAGAPGDVPLTLTMGDKGNQRDPWPYVRAVSVTRP